MTKGRTYDVDEVEAIRRDMLTYKLSSGHGAPRLAAMMSEANNLKETMDLRRISRFIAGKTKNPRPWFLGWCETFLATLPKPPDPIFRLAQGLKAFCTAAPSVNYAGEYRVTVLDMQNKTPNPSPSAKMKISSDEGFWRVEERFLHNHRISDGALIATQGFGLMLTKERLTQITRLCTVVIEDVDLIGYAISVNQQHSHARFCFKLDTSDA